MESLIVGLCLCFFVVAYVVNDLYTRVNRLEKKGEVKW